MTIYDSQGKPVSKQSQKQTNNESDKTEHERKVEIIEARKNWLRKQGIRPPASYSEKVCDYCQEVVYGTIKLPNGLRRCILCTKSQQKDN